MAAVVGEIFLNAPSIQGFYGGMGWGGVQPFLAEPARRAPARGGAGRAGVHGGMG